MNATELKLNQRVMYKAAGKVSRIEKVAGKWMPATVTNPSVNEDGFVTLLPDHRVAPGALFAGMQTQCEPKNIRII